MSKQYGHEQLRVDVPTLEPDVVLLAQLVELSSASAPSTTSSRASSMKVLLAAAGVAVVATTTWAAGAVPGNLFPLRPASHPHTVVPPTDKPSSAGPVTRTPGAPRSTSGASGLPSSPASGRSSGVGPGDAPSISSLFATPGARGAEDGQGSPGQQGRSVHGKKQHPEKPIPGARGPAWAHTHLGGQLGAGRGQGSRTGAGNQGKHLGSARGRGSQHGSASGNGQPGSSGSSGAGSAATTSSDSPSPSPTAEESGSS